jgi:hypothetical protein
MARSIFADDDNLVKKPQPGSNYDAQGNPIPDEPQQAQGATKPAGADFDAQGNPIVEGPQTVYTAPEPAAAQPVAPEQAQEPVRQNTPGQIVTTQPGGQLTGAASGSGEGQSYSHGYSRPTYLVQDTWTGKVYKEGEAIPEGETQMSDPNGGTGTPDVTTRIMNEIYQKGPTYDQKRPEEIRRITKMNAIGKGVSVLSEALALGLGGRVRRRPDDKTIPALWKDMKAYDDNYNRRKDEQIVRDRMNAVRAAMQKRPDRYKMHVANESERYSTADNSYRNKRLALSAEQLKLERDKFNAALRKGGSGKGGEPASFWQVWDDFGKPVAEIGLKDGEVEAAYRMLTLDPDMGDNIDALQAVYGDKFDQSIMRYLIGKYWQKAPGVWQFLKVKPNGDGTWTNADGSIFTPAAQPSPGVQPQAPVNTGLPPATAKPAGSWDDYEIK